MADPMASRKIRDGESQPGGMDEPVGATDIVAAGFPIQVAFVNHSLTAAFERWLRERGLHLFRVPDDAPSEGEFPTYGIGIS